MAWLICSIFLRSLRIGWEGIAIDYLLLIIRKTKKSDVDFVSIDESSVIRARLFV